MNGRQRRELPTLGRSVPFFSKGWKILPLLLAFASCPAFGEITLQVNTLNDVVDSGDGVTSLREAINEANAGSGDYRILLNPSGQFWAYTLTGNGDNANVTGDLDINASGRTVTITAESGVNNAWIKSAYADRLLHVRAGTVVVERVTFYHGQAVDDGSGGANGSGGAILVESGASLTLNNVIINDCHVRTGNTFGGAIYLKPSAALVIEGGALTANSSWAANGADGSLPGSDGNPGFSAVGGALCIHGIAIVNRCTISGNYVHGGDGGDGHQGGGGNNPSPGGAGGAGGGAMGAWAAVLGGLLKGDCVVLSGNSAIGGTGGDGGDGAVNSLGTYSTDGGDGGVGGGVYDSPRGLYVLAPAATQLGGYGDRSYTCGAGGAGGIAPTDVSLTIGSDGAAGAMGAYYACTALKCLDVNSYLSLDQEGTFSSFIGDIAATLLDTNGTTLCCDISRSSSSSSYNSGLCHTYTAAVVRVVPPSYGYRRGATPPSAFHRTSGLSDAQTASATLNNPMCNGPIYVSPSGSNQYPYCSWTYASRTITNALADAPPGSSLLLGTTTFTQSTEIVVSNAVTLQGAGAHPAEVIVRQTAANVPCFRLAHSNALIENLTITGARSSGNGGGVYFDGGGKVNGCIVTDNQAANGGGIYMPGAGLVDHTILRGNSASAWGGGAECTGGGALRNCLIVDNTAAHSAGGAVLGVGGAAENCTVYGNSAGEYAGGLLAGADAVLQNNIVWGNTAPSGSEWAAVSSYSAANNCTWPALGSSCITDPPLFFNEADDDFRLLGGSPCIDVGLSQSWMSGAGDIRGRPRVTGSAPDLGAYERSYFTITASAVNTNGVMTPTGAISCLEFEDTSFAFTAAPPYGVHDILVDGVSIGETNAYTFKEVGAEHSIVAIFHNIIYMSHDGTAVSPYTDWASAARTLDQATSAVSNVGLILITNGTYAITSAVSLDSHVTVRGFNGASNTTLAGQGLVQYLRLNHTDAVVEHVTLTGGIDTNAQVGASGAVCLDGGGMIQDCIVTGNAHTAVLLWHGGSARRCRFADNGSGVAMMEGGALRDSVLTAHRRYALWMFSSDSAPLMDRCTVVSNTGTAILMLGGAISNCLIAHNVNTQGFAGVFSMALPGLDNCVIVDNSSVSNAGGVLGDSTRLVNCTIANNEGPDYGGIYTKKSELLNCIIYSNRNSGMTTQRNVFAGSSNTLANCCTIPALGTACVTSAPRFADSAADDYRLAAGSPCIDAGTWSDLVPREDYLGAARPLDGNNDSVATPDIGAYEFVHPSADTDGDGMPDAWEVPNRTDAVRVDVDEDLDNDDAINWHEYVADTRPRDGSDWFHIREVRRTDACAICFVGSTQRIYTLYACTNIDREAWQTVNGCVGFWGIGADTSFVDTNAARHMSYTVGVSLP